MVLQRLIKIWSEKVRHMENHRVLERLRGGLIVSCQALPEEPLHSSYIMSRMAFAACKGGAAGIRANTVEDIMEIRAAVDLPVIGIIKKVYRETPDVYITPSMEQADALAACGVDIIALDATDRTHPGGLTGRAFLSAVREKYPDKLLMADCSTFEEGIEAARLGFDLIGTTLSGYTNYTRDVTLPHFGLVRALAGGCGKPVIAEGGIWTPEQLREVMDCGAFAAVVGTAITRPMDITRRFVKALK